MDAITISVDLPEAIASHFAAFPAEMRNRFATAVLTEVLADPKNIAAFSDDSLENSDAIEDAVAEFEAAEKSGDYGITMEELFVRLEEQATERRQKLTTA